MFSKYDVYTTVQSMYCYPDTDVLINKLNIHDKAELKQAEEEFTAVKQMALLRLQGTSVRSKSARATRCSTHQT